MLTGALLNQRYQIEDLVAEGGMARVFRAQDRLLGRTVALKVLREQYAADAAFLTRFHQEARAAAALSHPNIVNVYDVGAEGGINYIVMELVDGSNLKQIIQRDGAVPPARALDLAQQILAALNFAHQHGIVHRDVKPQNILVNGQGQAKVTDFGIARASSASQLTETGLVMGSVHYCAPEQAMGKGSSEASDVYSVGVVLYEMLAGQLPFESDNALGVALKHVQEVPPPLRQVNPRLSPALESIVNRALAKEPAARYANAEDMLQAIQAYRRLGDQSTAAFAAVSADGKAGAPASPGKAKIVDQQNGTRRKRHTIDWVVVVLSILILGMIAGWVPLASRLYDLYFQRSPAPNPTASGLGSVPGPIAVAPAPIATAPPRPSAAPSPSTTAQAGVEVPLLVGRTFVEAERQVRPLGLKLQMIEDYSEALPVGYVVSQAISPGALAPAGETVTVTVSVGGRRVLLPNVVGLPLNVARAELTLVGAGVDTSRQYNDRVRAGDVVSQIPVAQTAVVSGMVVSLVVSDGPSPMPTRTQQQTPRPATPTSPAVVRGVVPRLIALPEGQARQLIEAAGFSNTYTNYQALRDVDPANRDYFLSFPEGTVVSQDPGPGVRYQEGYVVRIAVRRD